MIKHNTPSDLLRNLLELLARHRRAFRQERSYWRVVGLVLGEMFNFGRHKVTQGLMALGPTDEDWSGWYRLFSRGRFAEPRVARIFFRETVSHTSPDEPFVVGVDGVQVPRKAKPAPVVPQRKWEAGLTFWHWMRQELDAAGRVKQVPLA